MTQNIDYNELGRIYENSLDRYIRKHSGIFYTSNFITNYICENTIGLLCVDKKKDLNFNEINFEKLQEYKNWLFTLKIIDPACGSGAFLNAALEFLIKEHQQVDEQINSLKKEKIRMFDTDIRILENNIFGVDINEESVEIAKLSLWLRTARKDRKLSDLNGNIKCGNSLINDKEVDSEKAFDWNTEFAEIMQNGGFDVVVGNPPYVNLANLYNKKHRIFYQQNYETVKNKSDLYSIFVERGHNILKNKGLLGFIFSNSWMSNNSFSKFREFLITKTNIEELVKLPADVFPDATVTTIILIFKKEIVENKLVTLKEYKKNTFEKYEYSLSYEKIKSNTDLTFSFKKEVEVKINTIKLGEIAKLSVGIKTANDKRFIFNEKKNEEYYPFLQGKDISRYYNHKVVKYIWYKPDLMRERNGSVALNLEVFMRPKLFIKDIAKSIQVSYDDNNLFCKNTINILYKINENFLLKYLLACLNSKYLTFWFRNKYTAGLHLQLNQLQQIPIANIPISEQKIFENKADKMLALNKELYHKKDNFLKLVAANFKNVKINTKISNFYDFDFQTFISEIKKQNINIKLDDQIEWNNFFDTYKQEINYLQQQINQTDNEIDRMVYQLYYLTEEEIEIIENDLK